MKKTLIIGSYNVGLAVIGDKIPAVGETVMGREFEMGPGGKGSNQAIALARLKAPMKFMCRVGDDHFGQDALLLFKKENISLDAIRVVPGYHTGVGVILIDKNGYNAIGVAPGANYQLSIEDLLANLELFIEADYMLIQLECRLEVVEKAIELARDHDVKVIFNPAPAQEISDTTLARTDFITPNETEAEIMSGVVVTDRESAAKAAKVLMNRGALNVIITMGDKGCLWVSRDGQQFFNAYKVDTVDSTGAGDAFNAGLVFGLANNFTIPDSIDFGSRVAALSVTKMGTVNGLPTSEEVLSFDAQSHNQPKK
ncbi:MAG TPA: ribokinase [Chryseolinea sp.]|nr:ribokinase [Chryseolinea sp.]